MKLKTALSDAKKFLVAAIGIGAQALALGLLTGTPEHVVQVLIAVAVALGVYVIPNKTASKTAQTYGSLADPANN